MTSAHPNATTLERPYYAVFNMIQMHIINMVKINTAIIKCVIFQICVRKNRRHPIIHLFIFGLCGQFWLSFSLFVDIDMYKSRKKNGWTNNHN